MNFIEQMCANDLTKIDEITAMPAKKVFLHACYMKDKAQIEKQAIERMMNR